MSEKCLFCEERKQLVKEAIEHAKASRQAALEAVDMAREARSMLNELIAEMDRRKCRTCANRGRAASGDKVYCHVLQLWLSGGFGCIRWEERGGS